MTDDTKPEINLASVASEIQEGVATGNWGRSAIEKTLLDIFNAGWNAALTEARAISMGTNDIGELPTKIRKLMV